MVSIGSTNPFGSKIDPSEISDMGTGRVIILPDVPDAVISGTWAIDVLLTDVLNGSMANGSNALNDEINWNVFLSAGNYKLNILHYTLVNAGIITIYLDDAAIMTIDELHNPAQHNIVDTSAEFTVTTNGLKTLRVKVTGKSGVAYYVNFSELVIYRTS